MVNMSAEFDENANNDLVCVVITRSKFDARKHAHTDRTTDALIYPFHNAFHRDKYTWAPQKVHNTPVMNILKGYFYMILF